jgi:formate dehydrogenase iron-sulfur subunit
MSKPSLSQVMPEISSQIRNLLRERDAWTAVESFSRWHEEGHVQSRHYEGRVPLSQPTLGERYAFEVDLDKCSGCKACVTACHSLNGLQEDESWRHVGLLHEPGASRQVTVTSSCHHCDDPACAKGCPTLSYEQLPSGIVRHLDDQCMGCRYCEWTCPYGAPQWNPEQGIVRKCDLCHQRLKEGEAPACVQACPNGAIAVRLVPKDPDHHREGTMDLPGTVDPGFTSPSTRYLSALPLNAALRPAHECADIVEDPHTPLAVLLVFTQWAVGAAIMSSIAYLFGAGIPSGIAIASFALLGIGLALGSLHLGHPERAWKAFLGWRRSWFSREVIVFGAAGSLFAGWAAHPLIPAILPLPPAGWLAVGSAAVGSLGVFCSAMIYMVTRRPTWCRPVTGWRFALTALGAGAVLMAAFGTPWIRWFGVVSIVTGIVKATLVRSDASPMPSGHPLVAQSRLLSGVLAKRVRAQALLFAAAVLSAFLGTLLAAPSLFWVAAALRIASDLVERVLFFQTATAARMPGGHLG